VFKMASYQIFGSNTLRINNSWTGELKPIDAEPDQALPYYKYVKMKDSITTMRSLLDGDEPLIMSNTLGIIGVNYVRVCNRCNLKSPWNTDSKFANKTGYLALRGWALSTKNDLGYADEGKFHVKNGQGYVRQTIIDTSYIQADGARFNKIRLADVPVKFRYDHKGDYLLIPIASLLADILSMVFFALIILIIVYVVYLTVTFLRFIADTSKGEIFTVKNVARLKLLSISLLCYPVYMYGINYGLRLIFHDYFIPGVVLKENLQPGLWMNLLLAIIFLLLYKAFRQGKKLKEEQDLTI
jgi:hypothetical protein